MRLGEGGKKLPGAGWDFYVIPAQISQMILCFWSCGPKAPDLCTDTCSQSKRQLIGQVTTEHKMDVWKWEPMPDMPKIKLLIPLVNLGINSGFSNPCNQSHINQTSVVFLRLQKSQAFKIWTLSVCTEQIEHRWKYIRGEVLAIYFLWHQGQGNKDPND